MRSGNCWIVPDHEITIWCLNGLLILGSLTGFGRSKFDPIHHIITQLVLDSARPGDDSVGVFIPFLYCFFP